MPKVKASPKHNPGKFRTHLAQVRKHLELAKIEHAKLGTMDTQAKRVIETQLNQAFNSAGDAWEWFINDLRLALPGYVEVGSCYDDYLDGMDREDGE